MPGPVKVQSLQVTLTKAPRNFEIAGAIYVPATPDNEPPLVSHVIVRSGTGSRFVLPPGKYVYKFHVEKGSGKFSVSIDKSSDDSNVASHDYDTARGAYALTLQFEVK